MKQREEDKKKDQKMKIQSNFTEIFDDFLLILKYSIKNKRLLHKNIHFYIIFQAMNKELFVWIQLWIDKKYYLNF